MRLDDKVALVTGAGRGIGRATALLFAEEGARVETAGYGGVPVRAVVPGEALSSIERGDLPVETQMEIRVPGYGSRAVEVRVSWGDEEGVAGEASPALLLTVPGYGHAPLRMTFFGRKR